MFDSHKQTQYILHMLWFESVCYMGRAVTAFAEK